jgi:hypothetical protein
MHGGLPVQRQKVLQEQWLLFDVRSCLRMLHLRKWSCTFVCCGFAPRGELEQGRVLNWGHVVEPLNKVRGTAGVRKGYSLWIAEYGCMVGRLFSS